jgi:hypothetical protein
MLSHFGFGGGWNMSDPTRSEGKPAHKHSRARRKLLKSLVVGTGAAATATIVPKKWVKPVVDAIEVPLHAQGSPGLTMTCQLDVQDQVFTEGTTQASSPLDFTSDSTDIDNFIAEIDPAVEGQEIHVTIVVNANDAVVSEAENDQDAVTNAGGQAVYDDDAAYTYGGLIDGDGGDSTSAGDGPNGDALSGFTATFSSPGVPDCEITVTFPPQPD